MNTTTLLKLSHIWLRQLGAIRLFAVLTALSALMASNARATLQSYESFNYSSIGNGTASPTAAATQTTSGGYTGAWTFGSGATASMVTGLTYSGLLTANSAMKVNVTGGFIQESFASALSSGTYYVSYLFKPGTESLGGSNGAAFMDDGVQIANSAGIFLGVESYGATAGKFTVNNVSGYNDNAGPQLYQSATADITYGTVNLIVLKLVKTTGNSWSATLWVNPTAGTSTEPGTSSGIFTATFGGNIGLAAFVNRGGANTLTFDEFRVATTWADAVSYTIPVPSVPTGLSVTSSGANTVSLSWTASTGATTYNVKRATTSGGTYTTVGTTTDPTVTYTDTVTGGSTYYYEVSAVNLGGESANSSYVSAAPTLGVPYAPTGLAATPGDSQVALTWTAPAVGSPTSYNVYRSTTSGSGYAVITTSGAQTTTSYIDSTAINGTTYYYVVSAVNATGEGANSSQVSATPAAFVNVYEPFNYSSIANGTAANGSGESGTWTVGATAPSIVTGLTYTGLPVANSAISSTGNRQSVNFTSSLSSGTKWISFLFKNSTGNAGDNRYGVYFPNGGTGLFFGYVGAYSGSQGNLGLASMNTVGTNSTGASAILNNSFLGTYGNTYFVVLKIDFNTSGTNDTVKVYINPTANLAAPDVAATYTNSSFDVGTITGIGLNVQASTLTIDEIRTGTSYGSVVGYNPPGVPTGVTATPGINQVGLNWTAASGATGYIILRGTTSGTYNTTNTTASVSYADITPVLGVTNYYVIEATNSSGISAYSSEVFAKPAPALPNTPIGLTAVGTNGAVSLSWSVATGAAGYNVQRSTSSGTETFYANVTTTSYNDTDVTNGQIYWYSIVATNSSGNSSASTEASATPNVPPAAPTGLSATAGTNQVSLSWTGSAGAVSYNVKRSTTSGSGYTTIGTTTDPTVAYLDTTAIKFTTYYYVVSAVNGYGEGANSGEVSATPAGTYGPSAYESFNYPTGAITNNTPSTATGFTGNWTIPAGATITTGLAYPGLPTSNNAYQHVATGSQNTVSLASSLSSGTAYISFLIQDSGNSGGDSVGIFLKGNNASSLFCGFEGGYSASQTSFGLGTVNSTSLGAATVLGSTTPIDNTTVHLAVIRIDFNTSGANDTVSLWIDPPTGVLTPGVAANSVVTNFDVGTISAFGINILGGYSAQIDEVRFGQVYGDVVIGKSAATVTLGSLSQTYDGTAKSASASTTPSGLTVSLTYDGAVNAPTNVGTYQVIGTVVDANYYGSATNNLVIDQAAATVTLGSLSQTYDGAAKSASASTTPSGLTVSLTYDGSASAPTNVGTYQVIGTVVDANYYGSATNNLVINSAVNTTPTNIVTSVSGNQLTLSWPMNHTGWTLQTQTNTLTGTWYDVAGSALTNQVIITFDPTIPPVFYRMKY